jgi:autotransporter-associated beta strand protein
MTFSISGGRGYYPSPSPNAMICIPLGHNLHETLYYNLVHYPNREVMHDDSALWEREPKTLPLSTPKRTASGYADLYTWQPRMILLAGEPDGEQLPHRLRQMIALLKEQTIDFGILLEKLLYWNDDRKRQGGSLTAGGITVNPGDFFNQTGGTMNAPITLAGGTVAAGTDNGLGSQPLTLTSGTLLNSSGAAVTLANHITVADGGTPTIGGAENNALTLTGTISLGAGSVLTNTNAAETRIDGIISGATGSIVQNSTAKFGQLTLNGANTYDDGTTLTRGLLELGSNSSLGTGNLTINGTTVYLGAGVAGVTLANNIINTSQVCQWGIGGENALTLTGTIDLGADSEGQFQVYNSADTTLKGDIKGGGHIEKDGTGTLTLSGNNTFTGGVELNEGSLMVASDTALGTGTLLNMPDPGQHVVIYASGARTLDNGYNIYGNFEIHGATAADTLTLSGNGFISNPLMDVAIINISGDGNVVLSGRIKDFGSFGGIALDSTGAGSLTLSGLNSYLGCTKLMAGTLIAGSCSVVDSEGYIVRGPFSRNTLFINGGTLYASGAQTVANPVTVGGDFNTGGVLATDVLTLSGASTLTGDRTINVNGAGSRALRRYQRWRQRVRHHPEQHRHRQPDPVRSQYLWRLHHSE